MSGELESEQKPKSNLVVSTAYWLTLFGLILIIAPALLILFLKVTTILDIPLLFIVFFLVGAGFAIIGFLTLITTIVIRSSINRKEKIKPERKGKKTKKEKKITKKVQEKTIKPLDEDIEKEVEVKDEPIEKTKEIDKEKEVTIKADEEEEISEEQQEEEVGEKEKEEEDIEKENDD